MNNFVSFAGGFALAITVTAIAAQTGDTGRYQISTSNVTGIESDVYETIIDTTTGRVVSRNRVFFSSYRKVKP